jgi:enamine deaminase RidA (YjgF/YER057c/UK114 family)
MISTAPQTSDRAGSNAAMARIQKLSSGERYEMIHLGILDENGQPLRPLPEVSDNEPTRPIVHKKKITNANVLNEACDYKPYPVSFSRGLRTDLKSGTSFLWISGTASVDEEGQTIHVNDFRAQCWRTFRNITELLRAEGATWKDLVRTTCYLRDIERDYKDFNEVRTQFYSLHELNPLPASTCIQARICRSDLLVEIEAIAILER